MAERPGFMIYLDLFPQLEEYSKAEVGELVFAMREYVENGVVPQFEDRGLRVIWRSVQDRLNRDNERYVAEVEKRKIDGKYGHYVKLCKARGETAKEKILWVEEDYLPSIKPAQDASCTLEDTIGVLNSDQPRKPTTKSKPNSISFSTGTGIANAEGAAAGVGSGKMPADLPDTSINDPVKFEKRRQEQLEKLAAYKAENEKDASGRR